jgi:C4-dicarboxylate-specific signal transduction histidine kinase
MSDRDFRDFAVTKLSRVVAQVDRAAGIISRMRIFSRSTREGPQRFDVRDACRGALILVAQPFRVAGIAVNENLGDEPLITTGHQSLIEQVLVNLLGNARDALSDDLGRDRKVEVSARRGRPGRLVVSVSDNGPGVPEASRDRVFEPFYTTKPEGKGTGLGLAVAFGIVRDAGGSLTLRPEGPGATFEIDLPETPGT